MGQQQLLLIVVVLILVAVALYMALSLFDTQVETSNRDAVILDLNRIAAFAHQYFVKQPGECLNPLYLDP